MMMILWSRLAHQIRHFNELASRRVSPSRSFAHTASFCISQMRTSIITDPVWPTSSTSEHDKQQQHLLLPDLRRILSHRTTQATNHGLRNSMHSSKHDCKARLIFSPTADQNHLKMSQHKIIQSRSSKGCYNPPISLTCYSTAHLEQARPRQC